MSPFEFERPVAIRTLIAEVKKRVEIYDNSLPAASRDKARRKKLWNEVGRAVYEPSVWDPMSPSQKDDLAHEMQVKWKSLRTCFRRELKWQKMNPTTSTGKRRRRYLYFEELSFLLPYVDVPNKNLSHEVENSRDGSSFGEEESSDEGNKTMVDDLECKLEEDKTDDESMIPEPYCNYTRPVTRKHISNLNDIDEDEAFFRSIIPSIKELTSDQKLMLRIELIQTVMNFKKKIRQRVLE